MKKILWIVLLTALVWTLTAQGQPEPPSGAWISHSQGGACPQNEICAEWLSPGHPLDGILCCIDQADMHSDSFTSCLSAPKSGGPRGGEYL